MRVPRHLWRDRYLHLARIIPRRLRMWCYIVCFAEATQGEYGTTDVSTVTAMEVLQRIEV